MTMRCHLDLRVVTGTRSTGDFHGKIGIETLVSMILNCVGYLDNYCFKLSSSLFYLSTKVSGNQQIVLTLHSSVQAHLDQEKTEDLDPQSVKNYLL